MAEINYEELGRAIAEQIKNALTTVNAPSHNEEKDTKVDYLVYTNQQGELALPKRNTRGTKNRITPMETLIFAAFDYASNEDFPNLDHKPNQADVMRLFNREGSDGAMRNKEEKGIAIYLVARAIEGIENAWKDYTEDVEEYDTKRENNDK